MNEMTPECSGLWGYLFGHRFVARYDEKIDYPSGTVEAMQDNLDKAMREGVALAFDAVENITEGYRHLDTNESVYVHDICTRCGQVVKRGERSETISPKPTAAAPQTTPYPGPPSPRVVAVPAAQVAPKKVVVTGYAQAAQMLAQQSQVPNAPPGAPGSPVKAVPGRGPK